MEFVESLFKYLWKTKKQKSEVSPSCVFFDQHVVFFESLTKLCLGTQHDVLIRSVDGLSGCSDNVIYLPAAIDVCSSYDQNYDLYKYLIIKIAGMHANRSELPISTHESLIAQGLETLKWMGQINSWIDRSFPEFKTLEKKIMSALDEDILNQEEACQLWGACCTLRSNPGTEIIGKINQAISLQKRNDELPPYFFATVPLWLHNDECAEAKNEKHETKNTSELKKKRSKMKPIKKTNLNEKEANPVIHSFEKLETLDKYDGGRRFDSGDDELAKHEHALDEVDLSHATTDGESSNSVYSVDDYGFRASSEGEKPHSLEAKVLLFHEWDYRSNAYKRNFCTLNVKHEKQQAIVNISDEEKKKYAQTIEENRKKFSLFKNDPKWLSRQFDGGDIETSQWARVVADLAAGQTPTYDMYTKKIKKDKNVSIGFLFDQSLSTDSWIENQKIINIMKDSLLIAGESLVDIFNEVFVSSTFSVSRKNCVYHIHKNWHDRWVDSYGSFFSMQPTGYTRLGPGIRYTVQELQKRKTKKNILFIVTDGKVSDIDPYEGRYGLHDVKKALEEARQSGIQTIGITLDTEVKSYFRVMFGKYRHMRSPRDFSAILLESLQSILRSSFEA